MSKLESREVLEVVLHEKPFVLGVGQIPDKITPDSKEAKIAGVKLSIVDNFICIKTARFELLVPLSNVKSIQLGPDKKRDTYK